jgi:hypothetical protein
LGLIARSRAACDQRRRHTQRRDRTIEARLDHRLAGDTLDGPMITRARTLDPRVGV